MNHFAFFSFLQMLPAVGQLPYYLYQVTGYEGDSVGQWVNAATTATRKYSMEIV
jgi:hypothetical protein